MNCGEPSFDSTCWKNEADVVDSVSTPHKVEVAAPAFRWPTVATNPVIRTARTATFLSTAGIRLEMTFNSYGDQGPASTGSISAGPQ